MRWLSDVVGFFVRWLNDVVGFFVRWLKDVVGFFVRWVYDDSESNYSHICSRSRCTSSSSFYDIYMSPFTSSCSSIQLRFHYRSIEVLCFISRAIVVNYASRNVPLCGLTIDLFILPYNQNMMFLAVVWHLLSRAVF